MLSIIKTEFYKLKRNKILLSGVVLMFLTIVLTLFTSMAEDGSYWDYRHYIEQVIKNNTFTVFPMCISLITGDFIIREYKNDTLKNILVVPVSQKKLIVAKIFVGLIISIFLGIILYAFTILGQFIMRFPDFSVTSSIRGCINIIILSIFLYISVLPIIVIAGKFSNGNMLAAIISLIYSYGGIFVAGNMRLANIYPITASLGIIGYRNYDSAVNWNLSICFFSIIAILTLSIILINIFSYSSKIKKHENKRKNIKKKGW